MENKDNPDYAGKFGVGVRAGSSLGRRIENYEPVEMDKYFGIYLRDQYGRVFVFDTKEEAQACADKAHLAFYVNWGG